MSGDDAAQPFRQIDCQPPLELIHVVRCGGRTVPSALLRPLRHRLSDRRAIDAELPQQRVQKIVSGIWDLLAAPSINSAWRLAVPNLGMKRVDGKAAARLRKDGLSNVHTILEASQFGVR